jgi:death on curing protein
MEASGGSPGIADLGSIESALAQPRATFADQELHSDLATKAAALCYSLITNHGFVDGNNRVGTRHWKLFCYSMAGRLLLGLTSKKR